MDADARPASSADWRLIDSGARRQSLQLAAHAVAISVKSVGVARLDRNRSVDVPAINVAGARRHIAQSLLRVIGTSRVFVHRRFHLAAEA